MQYVTSVRFVITISLDGSDKKLGASLPIVRFGHAADTYALFLRRTEELSTLKNGILMLFIPTNARHLIDDNVRSVKCKQSTKCN